MASQTSPRHVLNRLVALAIVGVVVTSVVFAQGVAASNHSDPLPAEQVVSSDGTVSVWERAPFPLRADMESTSTTVPNALLTLQDQDGNTRDLAKDPVGVYPNDSVVRLTFDDARASYDGGLEGREVTVVAARLSDDAAVPSVATVEGTLGLLTGSNVDGDGSFELVERTTLDDGTVAVEHRVDRPGQYVYFAATHEEGRDGLSADASGELTIDGKVTVVGVERVDVEETAASVSPPSESIPAGTDATVSVASNLDDADRVVHAFVIYDEETFLDQQFTVALNGAPDGEFEPAEDVTVRSTIASVDGEAAVETDASVMGTPVDGRVYGTGGVGDIVVYIAQGLAVSGPPTETSGETGLDASAVVFEGDPDPTSFEIGTLGDWSPGEYRWIYVGQDADSTRFSTATGTVSIGEAQTDVEEETDEDDSSDSDWREYLDDEDADEETPATATGGDAGNGAGNGDSTVETDDRSPTTVGDRETTVGASERSSGDEPGPSSSPVETLGGVTPTLVVLLLAIVGTLAGVTYYRRQ